MKDIAAIIKRNVLQPIVIAICILAATLLVLGERRDAWFISFVIMVNTAFAIVQEIRARRALRRLELINAPHARIVDEDGSTRDVTYDQLLFGDTIILRAGDEVPADIEITKSAGLEVNESMLTGEAASVPKAERDTVYASSVVVAGTATARVTAVGAESKAGVMATRLQRYEPQPTPLQRAIARTIAVMTYGALGLAVLIYVVYNLSGHDAIVIFKAITSAAVTVVPEGLLLASTLLLAFGSLRLAQAKVLPQKLAAIEAMALLDVLCVDKTGTLTSDTIVFDELRAFDGAPKSLGLLAGIVARETANGSETSNAMLEGLPSTDNYTLQEMLSFSSERKMSGARFRYRSRTYTIMVGAPEIVAILAPLNDTQQALVDELTREGQRVLLVASFENHTSPLKKLRRKTGSPIGLIVLTNELRSGVTKTVAYLQKHGVDIRVISGDNAATVRYVAEHVGISGSDKVITGAELAEVPDHEWDETVARTTIFARVLPEQKERLIATFRSRNNFTGMVGDGVNDALALKEADLGVAMFSGAAVSRRVADIVLLNNSFNALPLGMKLGSRIMQAIEIIATLFFHKIIYGVVLLISTLILGIVYPFEPRHVTFLNIFLVSLPTVMWTLVPPVPSYTVTPKYFWRDTLGAVWPIALISGTVVATVYATLETVHGDDMRGVQTTTVLVATYFGILLVFLMQRIFPIHNTRPAQLARGLYALVAVLMVVVSFGFGFIRDFFDFTAPAWRTVWPLVALIIMATWVQWQLATRAGNKIRQRPHTKV